MMNSRTRMEAAARPRLVALLGLEVVEDLRQLPVGLEISRAWKVTVSSCVSGEDERRPVAVLELEELRDVVAAARLPELGRRQRPA